MHTTNSGALRQCVQLSGYVSYYLSVCYRAAGGAWPCVDAGDEELGRSLCGCSTGMLHTTRGIIVHYLAVLLSASTLRLPWQAATKVLLSIANMMRCFVCQTPPSNR
eukprot:781209-Pelagomonas_calceolata.AAC.3